MGCVYPPVSSLFCFFLSSVRGCAPVDAAQCIRGVDVIRLAQLVCLDVACLLFFSFVVFFLTLPGNGLSGYSVVGYACNRLGVVWFAFLFC